MVASPSIYTNDIRTIVPWRVGGLVGNVLAINARGPGSSLASAQGNRFSDGQFAWICKYLPVIISYLSSVCVRLSVCMFTFQHCGILNALLCSSFLPALTCLLCLVYFGYRLSLFVISYLISCYQCCPAWQLFACHCNSLRSVNIKTFGVRKLESLHGYHAALFAWSHTFRPIHFTSTSTCYRQTDEQTDRYTLWVNNSIYCARLLV